MPAATLSLWEDFEVPPQARRGQITLNLYDHLAAYVPKRPAAYLRISHDRFGLEAGVDRQLEDANDARRRMHWPEFVKVYKENDTSAFRKRKVVRPDGSIDWVVLRPQFRQLLADLASGVIDGVIFYDLDRLVRRPRDLEDLIDIVEYVKRPVLGATGGHMNLINDSDRHMARIMCVMALKSSEDTSRRVARMHLACAQEGKIQGRIAYGWIRRGAGKGKLLLPEAEVVQHIYRQCLTGESAYGIATKFNKDGLRPPEAKQWSSTMITKMLRNPRYCGMVSYGGQHRIDPAVEHDGWSRVLFDEEGRPLLGSWDQIVEPRDWSQVQFELQLRRQKQGLAPGQKRPSVAVKHVLTGVLTCCKCTRGLIHSAKTKNSCRAYRCPPSAFGGCAGISISADVAEAAISEAFEAFLVKQFQAADLPAGPGGHPIDVQKQLAAEIDRKRTLISQWSAGTLADAGLEDEDYFAMLAALNRKISRLHAAIAAHDADSPRRIPFEDLLQSWRSGTAQQRRALLKHYLHEVRVLSPIADAPDLDSVERIRARLEPRWKSAAELAA